MAERTGATTAALHRAYSLAALGQSARFCADLLRESSNGLDIGTRANIENASRNAARERLSAGAHLAETILQRINCGALGRKAGALRRQERDHIVESAAQPSQRGSRHPLMVHTFLDFELDEELRELRCLGAPGATQGRVFDLIAFLLRARDRVVSRDELMDALWQGNVVSDTAISQVIMLARKALRDEGESQRVIKTVRGHGVRFVAGVESRERKSEPPLSPVLAPELVEREVREPLLGRSSELRTLLERLGRAELGEGSLVLIEGEPGVGKTTLAEQLARWPRSAASR